MKTTRLAHNRLPDGVSARNCLYAAYKSNAKRRGIPFLLTLEEFWKITIKTCSYCNCEPFKKFPTDKTIATKLLENKKMTQCIYNGIDRIDSLIPYQNDNVVACCDQCNYMKRSYTEQEFLVKVLQICNHRFKP